MVLTEKQKDDLHKAILEYLRNNGFEKTFAQFKDETKIPESEVPTDSILEKKWVSIIRLQKKIDELQSKLEQIKEESSTTGKLRLLGKDTASDHLLQMPEKQTLEGHRGQITKLLFHPVYSLLVSASEDASIKVWDVETGKPEKSLKGHAGVVNSLSFNATGTLLASASSDLTIKLWNFQTFECTKTLQGHDHDISDVCLLPSGDHLVSASRDKTIKLWEISTGFCIKTFTGHNDWVRRVTVHPQLPIMASGSKDQTIIIWDLSLGQKAGTSDSAAIQKVLNEHTHVIEAIVFANVNANRTIAKSEYYVKLMNQGIISEPGKEEEEVKHKLEGKKQVTSQVFLASCSRDKLIKIWDVKDGRVVVTLTGHDDWVRDLIFHPNGKYLISVSDDKSIRMWDLLTGRCIKKMAEAHNSFIPCIDISEKYWVAATGSANNVIKLWQCS